MEWGCGIKCEGIMELLFFILAAYGLTQIIVYGKVFDRFRPTKGKLGELFKCPMCMGFHIGWLLMFLSPFTELFSFEVSAANFFILGGLSSGTSYVLSMLFDDDGLKIKDKSILVDEEVADVETDFFVNEDEVIH
tara:strand:+ start:1721 stop:2125 length:405 start_codon:yes stop_codon:yes gene_type:complete